MVNANTEITELLQEIRDLLKPISVCFEEQYAEIQHQCLEERFEEFEELLTPARRDLFPLLFDPRRLSQAQIAEIVGTTQPTVSRFINALVERGLIEQTLDDTGAAVYKDPHGLKKLMEATNGQE
jgi:predicted transcriptional regulator